MIHVAERSEEKAVSSEGRKQCNVRGRREEGVMCGGEEKKEERS